MFLCMLLCRSCRRRHARSNRKPDLPLIEPCIFQLFYRRFRLRSRGKITNNYPLSHNSSCKPFRPVFCLSFERDCLKGTTWRSEEYLWITTLTQFDAFPPRGFASARGIGKKHTTTGCKMLYVS